MGEALPVAWHSVISDLLILKTFAGYWLDPTLNSLQFCEPVLRTMEMKLDHKATRFLFHYTIHEKGQLVLPVVRLLVLAAVIQASHHHLAASSSPYARELEFPLHTKYIKAEVVAYLQQIESERSSFASSYQCVDYTGMGREKTSGYRRTCAVCAE